MWNWTENQIELYLIRHGMTLGNVEHRYIGRQTDEPLSEDGRQQLEKRKDQWAQVCRTWDMSYVFVSPMLRCRQTAEILFPQIPQIEIDPWREMDFGEFEGKNYIELQKNPNYQAWIDSNGTLPFPGGESRETFIKRCEQGFYRMLIGIKGRLQKMDEKQPSSKITAGAVVHGGTIMAILSSFYGGDYFDHQVKNGGGYRCLLSGTREQPKLQGVENIMGESERVIP